MLKGLEKISVFVLKAVVVNHIRGIRIMSEKITSTR